MLSLPFIGVGQRERTAVFLSIMPKRPTMATNILFKESSRCEILTNKSLKTERDAKSRAYLFIIERGLFQEFYEFCKTHPAGDYHAECVKGLSNL